MYYSAEIQRIKNELYRIENKLEDDYITDDEMGARHKKRIGNKLRSVRKALKELSRY
jgi:hypothetical protein